MKYKLEAIQQMYLRDATETVRTTVQRKRKQVIQRIVFVHLFVVRICRCVVPRTEFWVYM